MHLSEGLAKALLQRLERGGIRRAHQQFLEAMGSGGRIEWTGDAQSQNLRQVVEEAG